MKKILLAAAIMLTVFIFKTADAQGKVNINIGAQPAWGPVGYDYVDYYYMPDIQTYYYVPQRKFVYLSNNNWVFSSSLPVRYRNYDLYNGYKVVINEPRAYEHFVDHRTRFAGYRGNHGQVIIRNSNEPKYYVVRGHPKFKENEEWHDNGNGRGHAYGHGNGHGRGRGRGDHD